MMEINKCRHCEGNNLYNLDENSVLCIDCGYLHQLRCEKCDTLSLWLWRREYKKIRKEQSPSSKAGEGK